MNDNAVYFVYTVNNGRITPEKWYGRKLNSRTGKIYEPLYIKLLTESERNLTFAQLCEKYPAPIVADEDKVK